MGKPNARERLLEAASRLFHKHGYANVGINEIIKQADTAKASFYQHFTSKEALCEAWLEDLHRRSDAFRAELLEADIPVKEKLVRYFEMLAQYLVESEYRGCPFSNTCAMVDFESEGVMKQIQCHKESILEFFHQILVDEFGDNDNVRLLANQIFVLKSGATSEAQNLQNLWPVEAARDAAISLVSILENA